MKKTLFSLLVAIAVVSFACGFTEAKKASTVVPSELLCSFFSLLCFALFLLLFQKSSNFD